MPEMILEQKSRHKPWELPDMALPKQANKRMRREKERINNSGFGNMGCWGAKGGSPTCFQDLDAGWDVRVRGVFHVCLLRILSPGPEYMKLELGEGGGETWNKFLFYAFGEELSPFFSCLATELEPISHTPLWRGEEIPKDLLDVGVGATHCHIQWLADIQFYQVCLPSCLSLVLCWGKFPEKKAFFKRFTQRHIWKQCS